MYLKEVVSFKKLIRLTGREYVFVANKWEGDRKRRFHDFHITLSIVVVVVIVQLPKVQDE